MRQVRGDQGGTLDHLDPADVGVEGTAEYDCDSFHFPMLFIVNN